LLILLAGCFGIPDDSPGATPTGAISGTIARPEVCCGEPSESYLVGDAISPNVCDDLTLCDPQYVADWFAWANVEVTLTTWVDCEEVEIASTMTDENGEYFFEEVPAGKNYIITAICPEEIDFKVKDVAEEVVEGETYDAGISDAESTVLALCLEGLGEICLDSDVIDLDDFRNHFKYDKVICEVCEKLAECLYAIPVWVCELTELCPGYTPGEGEGEDECDDNIAPSINSVELDGVPISINDTVNVVVGIPYDITVNASDDGILGSLSYSATVNGIPVGTVVSNVVTVTPLVAGTFEVYVYVNDGCDTTSWGPVTVVVECPPITADAGSDQSEEVCPETQASIDFTGSGTGTGALSYSWDFGNGGSTEDSTEQSPQGVAFDVGNYTVTLTVTDDCSSTTDTMEVEVTECINTAPRVDSIPEQAISAVSWMGSCIPTYKFTVSNYVSDDEGDILTYSFVGGKPTGMTITSGSGKIVWTPDCIDFGSRCHGCGLVCITVRVQNDGCCQPLYTDVKICIEVWSGTIDGGNEVGIGFDGCPIYGDACP
jgi:PKD repeat protein